jgi:hypothetical protein
VVHATGRARRVLLRRVAEEPDWVDSGMLPPAVPVPRATIELETPWTEHRYPVRALDEIGRPSVWGTSAPAVLEQRFPPHPPTDQRLRGRGFMRAFRVSLGAEQLGLA